MRHDFSRPTVEGFFTECRMIWGIVKTGGPDTAQRKEQGAIRDIRWWHDTLHMRSVEQVPGSLHQYCRKRDS